MPDGFSALLSGSYWTGIEVTGKSVIVTYSFPTTPPAYLTNGIFPTPGSTALSTWAPFSAAEQDMARAALAEWGDVSGIIFIEVAPGQGDINFQKVDLTGTGYDGAGGIGFYPFGDWSYFSYPSFTGDLDVSGDVIMNSDFTVVYGTLLHEIGHALGLKHPTEAVTDYAANPPVVHDVWAVDDPNLTIMSQLSGGTGHLTATDIAAIQAIYGTQAQDGSQVGSWSWNAANQTLTQRGFATSDVIRGSSVRDVIAGLGGNDKLFGLAGNDVLNGGPGNDTLDGGTGNDQLIGGPGDDVYFANRGDLVVEAAGQGHDLVYAATTFKLAANVEDLSFLGSANVIGTGNELANAIFAGAGSMTAYGLAGDDYIVGGAQTDFIVGGEGADYVFGLGGADRFVFNSVAEFGGPGTPDAIGDFSHVEHDRIDLRAIDPDAVAAGDQSFSFVGTAAFTTDARYQVRYDVVGGNTVVQIDLDHDRTADVSFILYGVTKLYASDFLL